MSMNTSTSTSTSTSTPTPMSYATAAVSNAQPPVQEPPYFKIDGKIYVRIDGVLHLVLLTGGNYGASWSTGEWGQSEASTYMPLIIFLLEGGKMSELVNGPELCEYLTPTGKKVMESLPEHCYTIHAMPYLKLAYIKAGTKYRIVEHRGTERIELFNPDVWITA